jgi:GTPase involved in cell partitioning and DNA repair
MQETGEILGELNHPGDRLIVAKGGEGGRGNAAQKITRGTAPKASPAQPGDKLWLKLELRLVADVGLVGESLSVSTSFFNGFCSVCFVQQCSRCGIPLSACQVYISRLDEPVVAQ